MRLRFLVVAVMAVSLPWIVRAEEKVPRGIIIVVADGLRGSVVDTQLTPNLDALRKEGVSFPNSHSLFPTVTTANASVIATGHYLGDTGNFSNSFYAGAAIQTAGGSQTVTPFIEDDVALGDLDAHLGGNYLNEVSLLAAARSQGFSTAALGKLGPTLIQDHTNRGATTLTLDDLSDVIQDGRAEGVPVTPELAAALRKAGLPLTPPLLDRPNLAQQTYFSQVAGKVVLPLLKRRGKPFVMVFWMRDPDITQHGQLDSRFSVVPGINGSTSLEAIRNADRTLGRVRAALKEQGMEATTDVIVTSDHGFSTISKQSDSSPSVKCEYQDVQKGQLPPGFLAMDMGEALNLPVWDADANNAPIRSTGGCGSLSGARYAVHPKFGNALLGSDVAHPAFVVASGAGSALIYPVSPTAHARVAELVAFLLRQDYVGGIFADPALGPLPGTIPLNEVGLSGTARTPHPALVVSFRSYASGCDAPLRCGVEVADSSYGQGQGMHGAFSRADTFNFMAAVGPSFRAHFVDPAPVSNADLAPTVARIMGIPLPAAGHLTGRILAEALPDGHIPSFTSNLCLYPSATLGSGADHAHAPFQQLQPALLVQVVGSTRYFDAAGLIGRTLGLPVEGGTPCALSN